MILLWATYVTLFFAAVTAVGLAWRRKDHRPFAAFLAWLFVIDTVRVVLADRFDLMRPLGSPPFTGAARVALHIDQAGELSSTAGLAMVAILICVERRALASLPLLAWVASVVYLSTHYPEIRGDALRRIYLAGELTALGVVIASIVGLWWRRAGMTPARQCLFSCVAIDVCTLFAGAWRWGLWERWSLNQAAFALLYATLTVYQGVLWLRSYHSR
jgi:hypothetical protein